MFLLRSLRTAALAGLVLASPAYGQGGQAPLPAVSVVQAQMEDVTRSATFVGRVEAVQRVDLRARITGFLEQQNFEDGAYVKAGDLLFVIEKAPFAARVQEAEANLEAALAQQENARFQLERAEQLVSRGNIPQATVDERRADFLVRTASVSQTRAALENARITYSYTEIRTPVDGRVGRAAIRVGNLVAPESGVLATVVNTDPTYVTFTVAANLLLDFRRSAEAAEVRGNAALQRVELQLQLSDGTIYEHTGTLDFADVQVDTGTNTVTMRGTFPNPDNLLIDRQFVVVSVRAREPKSALTIPRTTVGIDQRGTFVLVVGEGNRVEQRVIRLGDQFGSNVAVLEGLQAGDRIITDGLTKVRPGMEVNPVPAAER